MFVNAQESRQNQTATKSDERVDIQAMTRGVARGCEEAFNAFYQIYSDSLFSFLLVLTRGNEELARDCLQETMVRVIRYVKPVDDPARFWNWLRRVARSTWIDELRKRKKGPTRPVFFESATDKNEEYLYRLLDEAVDKLPRDEKELIEGKYFQKKTYLTLAEELRSTAKAIESKLGRIRKKMRRMILEDLHHESEV